MSSQTILVVCVLFLAQNALCVVFEFGKDHPSLEVVAHRHGEISLIEKVKYISFTVPVCYSLQYVRVQVDNLISNPSVKFNKATNTVIVSYQLWQNSLSIYDVTARASRIFGCTPPWGTLKAEGPVGPSLNWNEHVIINGVN
ncbi:uncharacterized protein LOC142976023 [Anticarsia gemmatalis]|uniref:uncharacterized protein LOC142976023 n=1 Tax=Anticarsia gemmatalis TaxID=129554 RepID=UPI003F76114C